ncbi:MAG TPA: hypothetical protein VLK30_07860 [Candidatus Limnocylindrales bacterium]|nr:hypothetical protein [Candidatus Limnocylindrales bacterium]
MESKEAIKRDAGGGHAGRGEMPRRFVAPVVGGLALLIALLGLIGTAIRDPRPHDIPVGLVGPAPAVQQISTAFGTNAPGAFRFTTYSFEADARSALDSRDVDGVLVVGGPSPRLILAGAAGDAETGIITAALTNVFQAQGTTLELETVHPFASGDAHGLILFFVVVAVIISALVTQALLFGAAPTAGFTGRLAVVIVFAVLAGLTAMGGAAWIAGDYGSGFWAATGLVVLAATAVGAAVAGSARLLGAAGLGLAALVVVLLDLVSSGGPAGSQLLPDFYRALAPWMPAGSLYSSLRGALYFDGAGTAGPIGVLAGWLVAGIVLLWLGQVVASRRRSSVAAVPAST